MDKIRETFIGVISLVALVVIVGLIRYTPTIVLDKWLELVVLSAILLYFQYRAVPLADSVKLSLSVAVYITLIFVYGIGEAMWMALLVNMIYGLITKAESIKILLNSLQRALTALIVGVCFNLLHRGSEMLTLPSSIGPMLVSLVLYTFTNLLLVSVLAALLNRKPVSALLDIFQPNVWINSLLLGYAGVVFSFFIYNWRLFGLLVFSVLLISASELMNYSIGLIAEQQRRIKAEQELILDSKTKVFNYRYLSAWLDNPSDYEKVALLFIDIDDFKIVNDLYGHEHGDEALKLVAQNIKHSVRQNDQVVRFGGEEFVVILPNTDRIKALHIAKRIQARLADSPQLNIEPQLTVSIGIAAYPEDARDRLDLLRAADMAMYRAKSLGKNQCCTCS